MEKMRVNLSGLTVAEAEVKIRDMIDMIQREATAAFMTAVGADVVDVDAVERRAELVQVRNQLIEKVREIASRGGQGPH
jgi:hypothetical protein